MDSDTLTIRQGATFYEPIQYFDIEAESATITVSDDEGNIVLTATTNFTIEGDVVIGEFLSNDTNIEVGTYSWMITIELPDATVKLPNVDDCDGDCELPEFIVCEANDMGDS